MKRIDALTAEQRGRMDEWADRWIAIGLSTERADFDRFEVAARACYRYAGLTEPRVVVRVSSPLVAALAGPIAGAILDARAGTRGTVRDAVHGAAGDAVGGAVGDAVGGTVRGAVSGAVGDAVNGAVNGAVSGAVGDAVDGAVNGAVNDAVDGAVNGAVNDAVDGAVNVAVRDAVDGAVDVAVRDAVDDLPASSLRSAVRHDWVRYMGGQFWVGGWWGSPAYVSFFLDVCGLELKGDLADRARAYAETASSASWWWPHRDFIMVADRPLAIHTELVNPNRPRGWGSHRLHNTEGPAVVWPDGWGVFSWHGTRVEPWVIETPAEQITAKQITGERNAEVRRVLVERVGAERYMALVGGKVVSTDDWGRLWEAKTPEPMRVVELVNSTPEPDGHSKVYWLRVPHTTERRDPDACVACGQDLAIVPATPLEAVAWSYSCCPADYAKVEVQT